MWVTAAAGCTRNREFLHGTNVGTSSTALAARFGPPRGLANITQRMRGHRVEHICFGLLPPRAGDDQPLCGL